MFAFSISSPNVLEGDISPMSLEELSQQEAGMGFGLWHHWLQ